MNYYEPHITTIPITHIHQYLPNSYIHKHDSYHQHGWFFFSDSLIEVEQRLLYNPLIHDAILLKAQKTIEQYDKVFVRDMYTSLLASDEQKRLIKSLIKDYGKEELSAIIYELAMQHDP